MDCWETENSEGVSIMIRVKTESFDYEGAVRFFIYESRPDGLYILYFKDRVVFEKVAERDCVVDSPEPTFMIPAKIAVEVQRALVDGLSEKGFIPASTEGVRGKLEATERHLEDMRGLVKLWTTATVTQKGPDHGK